MCTLCRAAGSHPGLTQHPSTRFVCVCVCTRAPLAGRVSMDMITVDVTDLPGTSIGDPVTLWGKGLPVNEVAASAGTIGYEVLTRMTGRVPLRHI